MLLTKLAFRNILRQRRRSLLTALSMTGGYLLLCLSVSLTQGSYANLIDMFTHDHTGHIQIHRNNYIKRPKMHMTLKTEDEIDNVLESNEDVVSYTRRIYNSALAYAGTKTLPVSVVGVDAKTEIKTSQLGNKLVKGEFLKDQPDQSGYYTVVVGVSVAETLKIAPGDELVLISQGIDGSISNDIFIVSGIAGTRTSWEKNRVFMSLPAAEEFFYMHGQVHEYAILLESSDRAMETAASLSTELNNPELEVAPWQVAEATFYKSMQADLRGNYVTLGVIVFIVCIGVLNTVVMSVLERTREFGVLKAIGTEPWRIMLMVVLETSFLALSSCLLGLLLALPLIAWFSMVGITMSETLDLGGIPYNKLLGEFSIPVFLMPLLIIVSAATLISIPPGIRAARITPVDAMRSN